VSLFAIPAQAGLPNLVVRETAYAQLHQEWSKLLGLWKWSSRVALVISIGIAVAAGLIAVLQWQSLSAEQLYTFAFGLLLTPLIALANLRGAALRGLRHVVLGQLPELIIRPAILIASLAVLALIFKRNLGPAEAMFIHVAAAATAFVIGGWMLWQARPFPPDTILKASYDKHKWIKSSIPLALSAGMQLINSNADIVMLGVFGSAKEVGIYRVVTQGGMLVVFGLQAINMVVAPHVARLHAADDLKKLQKLVSWAARASVAAALPPALLFALFGDRVLGTLFGTEFAEGHVALAILCVGQLVNAAAGTVGSLLNMTGYEKATAYGVSIAAAVNVGLNLVLIPYLGMNGAALATSVSLVVWNVILVRVGKKKLGIKSHAI